MAGNIFRAIDFDDIDAVRTFINPQTINTANNEGMTPLGLAADNGNNTIVRLLLEAGADVNLPQRVTNIPILFFPIMNLQSDIVKTLIAAGANVNARDNDQTTPLMKAARVRPYNENEANKIKELVNILLASGADVNAQDIHENTALKGATHYNCNILKTLIDAGANVNQQSTRTGSTALWTAVVSNFVFGTSPECVKILLNAGANPNLRMNDAYGRTILQEAKDPYIIRLLLNHGAEIIQHPRVRAVIDQTKRNKARTAIVGNLIVTNRGNSIKNITKFIGSFMGGKSRRRVRRHRKTRRQR
jgi:ankyrin repeat protein